MIEQRGNMWDAWKEADLFCITTCSTLKVDGRLVMGAGIAKEAVTRFPGIDLQAGRMLELLYPNGTHKQYGLLELPGTKLGLFQTKGSWSDKANLELIKYATSRLQTWADQHPNKTAHLNYPGIGCGGLARKLVHPVIAVLPDNITVWSK